MSEKDGVEVPAEQGKAVDRRALLQAGLAGVVGAAAGAVTGLLGPGAVTADAGTREAAGPKPAGRPDPRIGAFGRADESGFIGHARQPLKAVPTSCLQCVAICGIIGYVDSGGKLVKIEGNPYAPNNRGMTCAKAQAGPNQLYDPDRLLHPLVRVGKRGEGRWRRISMKEALDLVVDGGVIAGKPRTGLREIYRSGHPEEFMFHYGRSRIKAAVNHFVSTAFGSKSIGNHTSICETAKWLGNEITLGKHYDINDVERSRYVLIFGANVLEAHTSHTYLAQRLLDAKQRGTKVVTFDVRMSNTAALSDEWVPVRPGTDLAVLLAMTHVVLANRLQDSGFIDRWTNVKLEELREHYRPYTPEWAEQESGVAASTIRRLAREFATRRPSTIVTYRGLVGHYNGAHAEWAARTLDALVGNMMVPGGTQTKISGKCVDAYAQVAKKHPKAVRKAKKLKVLDGEGVLLPTHHTCQWINEMIAAGKAGRPKLYMTYCYNGAYTTGDCGRNLEILADEEAFPFIVACDVAMSETTAMADLILPDATYLERWTLETPQSYALEPFIQLRQPVVPPRGESMDMQDIFIQLARRIGGGMAELHPFDSAREMIAASVRAQQKTGKPLFTVDGKPLTGDAWEYLTRFGVLRQGTRPSYRLHEKKLSAKALKGALVDEPTGVVWRPEKAGLSTEQAARLGYSKSKNAYKGYVGQCLDRDLQGKWDTRLARKGFKPDKLNKTGRFEIRSRFMKSTADAVLADVKDALRPAEREWFETHLRSGLPCWVPVPEHRQKGDDQLVMVSFKVNVQIHSRSQNCKWLQEIYHANPVWLNPATARRLLGGQVAEGDMVEIRPVGGAETKSKRITARLHLTEAVHPEVLALSFHCGHWQYGRYASGTAVASELSGAGGDGEWVWWQQGLEPGKEAAEWSDMRGVHPNWIIPNTPARVSGQFRSNDTLVTIKRV